MKPESDNSPSPGGGRQGDLLRKRFAIESKLVKDFENVFMSDLKSLDRWEVAEKEREAVWKLLRSAGAMEGLAAVAFTFFGLNRLPRILARHAHRKQQQAANPYVLDKPGKRPQSPFQAPNQQAVEKQASTSRRRFLFTAMELTFDIGMSLAVGAGVAFLASDEIEAEKTFLTIPLQPGRSLISDKVCPNLLKEYQRQWVKTADNREVLQEPHNRALQVFKSLAQNCRHRQVMEHQLREEQGLSESKPVPIPDTGVIPYSEDPLLVMMEGDMNSGIDYKEAVTWVEDQKK